MATDSYAKRSGDHVSSIIDYINDVKPFHTKLTEVSEKYLFSERMSVSVAENPLTRSFAGADVRRLTGTTSSAPRSNSWFLNKVSDGVRKSWPVPVTSYFKYLSDINEDKFTVGINDQLVMPGILGYSYRDSPAQPVSVKKNGTELTKNVDYFLSRGILSFSTYGAAKWKRKDLAALSTSGMTEDVALALATAAEQSGALGYLPVRHVYGTVTDISGGNYEEWTLTCTQINPAKLSISGSQSGNIGEEATINVPFSNPKLSFTFTEVDGIDVAAEGEVIEIGDTFVLTPRARITVNPASPPQDWTIIKTDTSYQVYGSIAGWQPPASEGVWYYNGHIGFKIPKLEIWAAFSHNVDETTGIPGVTAGYDIGGYDLGPYEATDSLLVTRGKALRKTDIMCRTPKHILESASRVFVAYQGSTACPIDEVQLQTQLQPCHYTIKFVTPANAIVINSITQIKRGLTVGEVWTDGIVSFKLKDTMGYLAGDVFVVFLTHKSRLTTSSWYDELPYDTYGYNDGIVANRAASRYDEEYLPFHAGHGAVIFKTEGPSSPAVGDAISINKAINDRVRLKIAGADAITLLGSELDWIPLEIRVNASPPGTATEISAYLAGNPSEFGKVFTITQPLSSEVAGNSSAILTFDPAFFSTYLPLNKSYSIAFIQEEKYGQTLAVKITEDLSISTFLV